MTIVGTSAYWQGPATVTAVGTGPNDNWTPVGFLKGADLPSGTGEYSFFVIATILNISSVRTHANALTQIGIGLSSSGFPFAETIQNFKFDGSILPGRQGVPYHCARTHASGHNGGTWSSSEDLTIYGRIHQNGGGLTAGGFQIADMVIHAFDHTRLGSGNILYGAAAGGLAVYGGSANAGAILFSDTPTGLAADEEWLAFWHAGYYPDHNYNTHATLFFQYSKDKTFTGSYHGNGTIGAEWDTQREAWGVYWTQGGALDYCRWHEGGFGRFDSLASATDPGMRLVGVSDNGATASHRGLLSWVEYFLVDTTALGNWKEFSTVPDVAMYNEGGVALANISYEGHEFTRTFYADVEYLWSARALKPWDQRPIPLGHGNPYRLCIQTNVGRGAHFDYSAQLRTDEGYQTISGTHFDRLQAGEVQFRLFGWGLGTGTNKRILSREVEAVHWDWNDNPQVTPYSGPTAGPVVYVDPGYESLGLGALTEIPIQPEGNYDISERDPKHRLETDLGYEPTWPAFTTGRKTGRLRWSGLTAAERDTLAAFVSAQLTQAFKWTRPGYSEIALVAVSALNTSSQGTLYAASLDVIELVYTGP